MVTKVSNASNGSIEKEYRSGSAPPVTMSVNEIVAILNTVRICIKYENLFSINKISINPQILSSRPNGNQTVKNGAKPPGKSKGLKKVIVAFIILFTKISK